ncbi:phosphodiester glycosidase family protein [Halomicronema hongdechloris]|nr:phosphodiester glycosidase family protein [Halomicronema hongdechloris]
MVKGRKHRQRYDQRYRWITWIAVGLGLSIWLPISAPAYQPPAWGNAAGATALVGQVPSQIKPEDHAAAGNRIILNGTPIRGSWQQRSGHLGVSDTALIDIGVEFLNTTRADRQPVQWFSNPEVQPLPLTAWHDAGDRYLDLSPLANQADWSWDIRGGVLSLHTPTAAIQALRRGRQSWGDRIVLDLDRATTWQVAEDLGAVTVTVQAAAPPQDRSKQPLTIEGNLISSVTLRPGPSQTQLHVRMDESARPRVWTLPDPPRLIIDVRQDTLVTKDIVWAPGLRWQQRYVALGDRSFPVYSLIVDPRQANIAVRPIWTDPTTATGIAPLVTTARRWQTAAAINGGYFNRNNRLPLGAIRRDGQWISGPILDRGVAAWDETGNLLLDRLALQQSITLAGGQRFPIQAINSGYVQAGIGLYTSAWGTTYSPIIDNEVLVTVSDGRVLNQVAAGTAGSTAVAIPSQGYLLAVRAYRDAAIALSPGTSVQLTSQPRPAAFGDYPHAIGGGPLLLKGGRIVLDTTAEGFSQAFATQAAPRSALGQRATGEWVFVAAHNSPGGRGLTLSELAHLMQQLGCVQALNLDGGSSSSLYLGGSLLNRNPRTAARVHNGIGIFIRP